MNLRLLAVVIPALALLAGCSESKVVKAKADILAADRAFNAAAQKDGPKAAFLAFVLQDGKLLGEEQLGAGGIANRFAQLPETATLTWEPAFVDVSGDGDLGYTWGHYTLTVPLPKYGPKPFIKRGTYVTVWKREPSGSWKVVLDGGVADAPTSL